MSKTAQQKMTAFINECDRTRLLASNFVEASYSKNSSYSYAAGYLESMIVGLIMELPKARRESYRAQLEQAAQKISR